MHRGHLPPLAQRAVDGRGRLLQRGKRDAVGVLGPWLLQRIESIVGFGVERKLVVLHVCRLWGAIGDWLHAVRGRYCLHSENYGRYLWQILWQASDMSDVHYLQACD